MQQLDGIFHIGRTARARDVTKVYRNGAIGLLPQYCGKEFHGVVVKLLYDDYMLIGVPKVIDREMLLSEFSTITPLQYRVICDICPYDDDLYWYTDHSTTVLLNKRRLCATAGALASNAGSLRGLQLYAFECNLGPDALIQVTQG